MRNKIVKKVIAITVAMLFLFNSVSYALAPWTKMNDADTKRGMNALGLKKFAEKNGTPGAEEEGKRGPGNYEGEKTPVIGVSDGAKVDYDNLQGSPLLKNPMFKKLHETGMFERENRDKLLIAALTYYAREEAQIPEEALEIQEGYFEVKEGELPIARIQPLGDGKYRLVVHTSFVRMWNHILENDVWLNCSFDRHEERLVSVAWGVFYRLAKHEMADLKKGDETYLPKGGGHLIWSVAGKKLVAPKEGPRGETDANRIGGRYTLVNDGIWMWFLGSYAYNNNTRYNGNLLKRRLDWFFAPESAKDKELRLADEFPNLGEDALDLNRAILLAERINYNFFGEKGRESVVVPDTSVKAKAVIRGDDILSNLVRVISTSFVESQTVVSEGDSVLEDTFKEIEGRLVDYVIKAILLTLRSDDLKSPHMAELDDMEYAREDWVAVPSNPIDLPIDLDIALRWLATRMVDKALANPESLVQNRREAVRTARLRATGVLTGQPTVSDEEHLHDITSGFVADTFSKGLGKVHSFLENREFRDLLREDMLVMRYLKQEKEIKKIGAEPIYATGGAESDAGELYRIPRRQQEPKLLVFEDEAAKEQLFAAKTAKTEGPGAEAEEPERLSEGERTAMLESVKRLRGEKIEIIAPQVLGLKGHSMRKEGGCLRDIEGKGGEQGIVKCRQYSTMRSLKGILGQERTGKRILIVTKKDVQDIWELVEADPGIFKDVRLVTVDLPEGFAGALNREAEMSREEKMKYRSEIAMLAILARLYEKDGPESARTALLTMLENRGITGNDAEGFVNALVDEEEGIAKRIEKCLKNVYSLVQSLGRELEIMKEFWTYA